MDAHTPQLRRLVTAHQTLAPARPFLSRRWSAVQALRDTKAVLATVTFLAALWLLPPLTQAQDAVLVLSPVPVLTTLAGTGQSGMTSDTLAAAAKLASPSAVAYGAAGTLYVSDTRNHRVLRISPSGIIETIAGNGIQGFSGDNGPATVANLDSPLGLAMSADGTLYIADTRNHRVRRVTPGGTIDTVAGTGVAGFSGDLGPAAQAQLRGPASVALGSLGELYIADTGNHRVRRIALDGTIATIAGNGTEQASGDGGPATSAGLDAPSGVAFRATDGSLFVADRLNSRIRIVSPAGTISSLSAASAPVHRAAGVAFDTSGNLFIADTGNYKLRAVTSKGSGVLLGSGEQGRPEPTASYATTPLGTPAGVTPDGSGGVAFTDLDNHQVQHLALPRLDFASTVIGQTSPSLMLEMKNGGGDSLAVASVDVPSGFQRVAASGCAPAPFTLAAGEQCMLVLAFAPSIVGSQSGLLAVNSTALPQRALLTGTALTTGTLLASNTLLASGGGLSYVGTPVVFRARVLGTGTSTASGTVHLLDSSVELATATLGADGSAAFSTAALTAGQHSLAATYDGDTHYAASASAVLQQLVVLAPDFTVTPAATQMAVKAGSTASMDFVLQPINGALNQVVTVAFDGLPAGATAVSNAPTPLVLGSNVVTIQFAITTPAAAAVNSHAVLLMPLSVLFWLCNRSRSRIVTTRFSALVPLVGIGLSAMLAVVTLAGCGGGFLNGATVSGQSAVHTYPVTLTATTTGVTGSALVHTASVTLVVQ